LIGILSVIKHWGLHEIALRLRELNF